MSEQLDTLKALQETTSKLIKCAPYEERNLIVKAQEQTTDCIAALVSGLLTDPDIQAVNNISSSETSSEVSENVSETIPEKQPGAEGATAASDGVVRQEVSEESSTLDPEPH